MLMVTGAGSQCEQVDDAVGAVVCGTPVVVWGGSPSAPGAAVVVPGDTLTAAQVSLLGRVSGGGVLTVAATRSVLEHRGLRPEAVPPGHVALTVDPADVFAAGATAQARASCVRRLAAAHSGAGEFRSPGRIPVVSPAKPRLTDRTGHADAAIGLMGTAGRPAVAAFTVVLDRAGAVADERQAAQVAAAHGLPLVRIEDLQRRWRRQHRLVERTTDSLLGTTAGDFRAILFRSLDTGVEHLALLLGSPDESQAPLVRIHSECLTGDALGSLRCDCGAQLDAALDAVGAEGAGVVLYVRGHEGRGIGLAEKLLAYALQDAGMDTVEANIALGHPADERTYDEAAQILADLGIGTVRLLTNNTEKITALEAHGITVCERIPLTVPPTPHTAGYLDTKRSKLGHLLDPPPEHADGTTDPARRSALLSR